MSLHILYLCLSIFSFAAIVLNVTYLCVVAIFSKGKRFTHIHFLLQYYKNQPKVKERQNKAYTKQVCGYIKRRVWCS